MFCRSSENEFYFLQPHMDPLKRFSRRAPFSKPLRPPGETPKVPKVPRGLAIIQQMRFWAILRHWQCMFLRSESSLTASHRPLKRLRKSTCSPYPLGALGGTPKVIKSTARSGNYPANEQVLEILSLNPFWQPLIDRLKTVLLPITPLGPLGAPQKYSEEWWISSKWAF